MVRVTLRVLLLVPREDVAGKVLVVRTAIILVRLEQAERPTVAAQTHLVYVARAASLVRAHMVGNVQLRKLARQVEH